MNLSTPILICDPNEEIRLLLKNMLTRHGFFHLIEAQNTEEILRIVNDDQFILIHKSLLNDELKKSLSNKKSFLIISQTEDQDTINLSAFFGVKHLMSFPYSSKSLVQKISNLITH